VRSAADLGEFRFVVDGRRFAAICRVYVFESVIMRGGGWNFTLDTMCPNTMCPKPVLASVMAWIVPRPRSFPASSTAQRRDEFNHGGEVFAAASIVECSAHLF
jgi:hypothetical protein